MKKLSKRDTATIIVQPRWPYHHVFVSDAAYERLREVQRRLNDHDISIILTRGLEKEGLWRKLSHRIARCVGAALFWILFPTRRAEIADIFSSNGHTISADCLDIGIAIRGKRLALLPLGVFTPKSLIDRLYQKHRLTIEMVRTTLRTCGFSIHSNETEAMQIHCELGDSLGEWRHRA